MDDTEISIIIMVIVIFLLGVLVGLYLGTSG